EIFNKLIERGKYFTINRSRQFGKTTTISLLSEYLSKRDGYFVIETSFEGIGDEIFNNQKSFTKGFLSNISYRYKFNNPSLAEDFAHGSKKVNNVDSLSEFITRYVKKINKKIVLIIDEVDKSSNNQLFLSFLGMLRDKYLLRNRGKDHTFHSVILAGVHDIKTIKLKLLPDQEAKLNSLLRQAQDNAWNIAVDFDIDLSFKPEQIVTMLDDYSQDTGIKMNNKKAISEKLYYYTSGYPYLVSKLCKFIDEKIITERQNKNWTIVDVESAYKLIIAPDYQTTLFDSMFKNLQGYEDLHETVKLMVIGGQSLSYDSYDPVISFGTIYGIFKNNNGICNIHNRIFEQRIYNYLITRTLRENMLKQPNFHPDFYKKDELNLKFILQRFQQFMKENYSFKDEKFIERKGRLLFLSFLRPIINNKGYEFKEPVVADERRMDIAVTYNKKRYVVELKIWRGPEYHNKGLQQLSDYLDMYSLKKGYLLIYDFNKDKKYKEENITFEDKEIFAVWV
ncbi:MAG: AAA family ATPase, partial [Bacteroidetes bacterium]|nr:AAA family ATPase [Bacteroidota bacterium]